MKIYLEAIYREQAAENAFLEPGAENDDIILFIHLGTAPLSQLLELGGDHRSAQRQIWSQQPCRPSTQSTSLDGERKCAADRPMTRSDPAHTQELLAQPRWKQHDGEEWTCPGGPGLAFADFRTWRTRSVCNVADIVSFELGVTVSPFTGN